MFSLSNLENKTYYEYKAWDKQNITYSSAIVNKHVKPKLYICAPSVQQIYRACTHKN